ncbi:hypothetical protein SAMN04489712_105195 [Thermomonospora echinospora]|uniref:Uncharacterized protein n=1 Tax=Thermomonospora echinospora TaxID=1992 RepID=A0A1H6A513_9ACTN|nr:hypothetical protein SAMN04489712_105195 [Thermomonospora echinospora]
MAILALVVGVALALLDGGLGERVRDAARRALCPLSRNSSCPGASGPAGPLNPVQSGVKRPENSCYRSIDIGYAELNVTVPVRYVDVRGGTRLGYQIRRVARPGKPDAWQVWVYGWGELAGATPGLATAQVESDDALGLDSLRKVPAGAWLGVNGTLADIYEFDNEKQARQFPTDYAAHRLRQAADLSLATNPLTSLPYLLSSRPVAPAPLPPRKEWLIEGGPTAGFTAKADLFKKFLGVSAGGRGWHLGGMRYKPDGSFEMTVRSAGELEGAAITDIGRYMPADVRKKFVGRVNEGVEELARRVEAGTGGRVRLPLQVREHLKKNWPDVGVSAKGKASTYYRLGADAKGTLKTFTQIVDSQLNWFGRGADKVSEAAPKRPGEPSKTKLRDLAANIDVPISGERTREQRSLDLGDPTSLKLVQDFAAKGLHSEWDRLLPDSVSGGTRTKLEERFRTHGTVTKLVYDSDVLKGKLSSDRVSVRGIGGVELKLEGEHNALADAQMWKEGVGWVPWSGCSR